MNRMKKEAKRKYDAARKGLSEEEITVLDSEDLKKDKIEQLARKIHVGNFPEEYHFMEDSIADAGERLRGINPMSEEYIAKINKKREDLGVSPLIPNGMSHSNNDTWGPLFS